MTIDHTHKARKIRSTHFFPNDKSSGISSVSFFFRMPSFKRVKKKNKKRKKRKVNENRMSAARGKETIFSIFLWPWTRFGSIAQSIFTELKSSQRVFFLLRTFFSLSLRQTFLCECVWKGDGEDGYFCVGCATNKSLLVLVRTAERRESIHTSIRIRTHFFKYQQQHIS